MGVWIDEDGILVRPPETAHPGKSVLREMMRGQKIPEDLPPYVLGMLAETAKIRVKPERYAEALRDWAARGADSRYALSPVEVREFGVLYRRTSSDLVSARAKTANAELLDYLNDLVARSYAQVYRTRRARVSDVWSFLSSGFPRLFRHCFLYVAAAAGLPGAGAHCTPADYRVAGMRASSLACNCARWVSNSSKLAQPSK